MFQIPSTCTGCHACAAICPEKCIDMKDRGEGFLFPAINMENVFIVIVAKKFVLYCICQTEISIHRLLP